MTHGSSAGLHKTAFAQSRLSPNTREVCPHSLLHCPLPLERLSPGLTAHSGQLQLLAAATQCPVAQLHIKW